MPPAAWFRSAEVQRLLRRAGDAAGTAVSVWHGQAGSALFSITSIDSGFQFPPAVAALNGFRGREAAFRLEIAACSRSAGMAASAIDPVGATRTLCELSQLDLPDFAIEWGPYRSFEGRAAFERDFSRRIATFEHAWEDVDPATIAQALPQCEPKAVETIADWCVSDLSRLLGEQAMERSATGEELPPAEAAGSARAKDLPARSAGRSAAIALAAGDRDRLRDAVAAAFDEISARPRTAVRTRKAAALAVVAEVLVHAEHAGVPIQEVWNALPGFTGTLQRAKSVRGEVRAVCQLLARAGTAPEGPPQSRAMPEPLTDAAIAPLHRLVHTRLSEGLTLKEAACELGETPSAITHRLQRRFGLSYTQYVKRLRVDAAKELLRRTRLSVSDVARRVGMDDASNFAKVFRACEAMSPGEYRARYQRSARAKRA